MAPLLTTCAAACTVLAGTVLVGTPTASAHPVREHAARAEQAGARGRGHQAAHHQGHAPAHGSHTATTARAGKATPPPAKAGGTLTSSATPAVTAAPAVPAPAVSVAVAAPPTVTAGLAAAVAPEPPSLPARRTALPGDLGGLLAAALAAPAAPAAAPSPPVRAPRPVAATVTLPRTVVVASGTGLSPSLSAATDMGVPIAFGGLVALFLLVQSAIGRRDPRLAEAPARGDDDSVAFE